MLAAFDAGRGAGLLHLGAGEIETDLHPTLAYWRDFGQAFVARACAATDPADPKHLELPEPDPDELAAFAQAPPPMLGAELIGEPPAKRSRRRSASGSRPAGAGARAEPRSGRKKQRPADSARRAVRKK